MRSQHQTDPYHNLFAEYFYQNITVDFYTNLVAIVIIAVGIMILPFVTHDRQRNMDSMQYSAKKGRKVMRVQFVAAMFSAFVLIAGLVGGFTVVFLSSNADVYGIFYNQSVTTWTNIPWFDLTFMQFIAVFATAITITAMGAAALFFFLSVYSRDYVGLLLKGIPVCAIAAIIGSFAVNDIFLAYNQLYDVFSVFGIEFIVCGIVLITGLASCIFACKRVMRKDLL